MKITLKGQIPSGKNAVKITRTGKRYPSPRFVAWRNVAIRQIISQVGIVMRFSRPAAITIDYWPGDLRRRDVPGMADALFHLLERYRIVLDDSLLINLVWRTHEIDRENPRTEIEIIG